MSEENAASRQPMLGFTVPPAYHITKRIPEDLPFTVRPSLGRSVLILGGVFAAVLVPFLCLASFTVPGRGVDLFYMAALYLVMMLLAGAWSLYVMNTGGPTLAADEYGLWIRVRKWPVKAIWVPWEAIAQVYTPRWLHEKVVAVRTHDPNIGKGTGVLSALDQTMQRGYFGSKLTASVVFGDKREAEILAALTHYARGRTYIG